MTRLMRAVLAAVLLAWAAPAVGQVPQAWLVREGTRTRFVVGERGVPPSEAAGPGWGFAAADTVAVFPGAGGPKYTEPVAAPEYADVDRRRFPTVATGPGGEMWLEAQDGSDARAWVDFLDAAEAFYRHADDGIKRLKPQGPAVVGRFGPCTVMSLPAADSAGVARVSLSGGAAPGLDSVYVRRYLRWLVGPQGAVCTPRPDDTLSLFGLGAGAGAIAHPDRAPFLVAVPRAETSGSPVVPRNADEGWNSFVAEHAAMQPPPVRPLEIRLPEEGGRPFENLCDLSAEAMELCVWEKLRRDRMYARKDSRQLQWPPPAADAGTWEWFYRLLAVPCRALGEGGCPQDGWGRTVGTHLLAGFEGPLRLSDRVTSIVVADSVQWRIKPTDLASLAETGDTVTLRLLDGSTVRLTVARPSSLGDWLLRVLVGVGVAGVLAAAAFFGYRSLSRRAGGQPGVRERLWDALGFGNEVPEVAKELRDELRTASMGVVALGWAVGHPESLRMLGGRMTGWARRLRGALQKRGADEPGPGLSPKFAAQALAGAAKGKIGKTPVLDLYSAYPNDAVIVIGASMRLRETLAQNAANANDVLRQYRCTPEWASRQRTRRLLAEPDLFFLLSLAYELYTNYPGNASGAIDSDWKPILTEAPKNSLLASVESAAATNPLAWTQLGYSLAERSADFSYALDTVVKSSSRPQGGDRTAVDSLREQAATLSTFERVLLGVWLARSVSDASRKPDSVLTALLVNLKDAAEGTVVSDLPRAPSFYGIQALWLGWRLAVIDSAQAGLTGLERERDEEESEKEEVQPPLVTVVPYDVEKRNDGHGVRQTFSPPESRGQVHSPLHKVRLPAVDEDALLDRLMERVVQAVEDEPENVSRPAGSIQIALHKIVRGVVDGYVEEVHKAGEKARGEVASAAVRLEEMRKKVEQEERKLAARMAELDTEAGGAVQRQASASAAQWRQEAEGIVAPLVERQVAAQWEPYHRREERLEPFLRDPLVMDRVQGFLETLREDGFIDKVLALREQVPTETWLVLTDPSHPYLKHVAQGSVQALVDPVYESLSYEIQRLPDPGAIQQALEAGNALGCWIDSLWESLGEVDTPALRERLRERESAQREWSESYRAAVEFSAYHANVYRRLLDRTFGGPRRALGELRYVERAVLESFGLAGDGAEFPTRLRHYLEPSARPGCLGDVIRAVQYLHEAFPREQLDAEERRRFQEALRQRLASAGLPAEFHDLAAKFAQGVGLEYRPVRYYQAHIDVPEFEFIGREVTRISLSQRLGFDAQPSSETVVVRLRRPFFFENGTYYAGHAHVARP